MMAQYNGQGYYRAQNYGTKRYISVVDSSACLDPLEVHAVHMVTEDGTNVITDPGSIVFADSLKLDSAMILGLLKIYDVRAVNLYAQGTGTYELTGMPLQIINVDSDKVNQLPLYNLYCRAPLTETFYYDVYAQDNGGEPTGFISDDFDAAQSGKYDNTKWYVHPVDWETDSYFGVEGKIKAGNGHYYTTLYTAFPYQLTLDGEGVVAAYGVKALSDGMALLDTVARDGGVVAAYCPVILECTSDLPSINRLQPVIDQTPAGENNLLTGNMFNCDVIDMLHGEGIEMKNQVAYDAQTMRVLGVDSEGQVGLFTADDLDFLPANSAYLTLENAAASYVLEPVTTGIATLSTPSAAADDAWYNLQGVRVMQPGKGVYVRKGRKVIR